MNIKTFLIACLLAAVIPALAKTETETFSVGKSPSLDISNISGDIKIVQGSTGQIVVRATWNDDRIKVEFDQDGDAVTVETIYPENYKSRNNNGTVEFEVQFPSAGKLYATSVSGNIAANGVGGTIELTSVSGEIELTDSRGRITLNSTSGDVIAQKIGPADFDGRSISGDVQYEDGNLEPLDGSGDYKMSSISGSVRVLAGKSASFSISGSTVSGNIRNNMGGGIEVKRSKYGPGAKLRGSVNGGDVSVSVSTVSGNITIGR